MLCCPCPPESAALQPDEQPTKLRQEVRPVVSLSTPEEQHSDQDKCRENDIPDKVHPMDALTATKARVLILDIKTIPALHITNQPRQKSSTVSCLSQPTDQWISKKSSQLYRCTVSLGSHARVSRETAVNGNRDPRDECRLIRKQESRDTVEIAWLTEL